MTRHALLVGLSAILFAAPLARASGASDLRELASPLSGLVAWPTGGNTCTAATALDDGTFENGYRIPHISDVRFVQRITPAVYPVRLSRVCVCWLSASAAAQQFSVVLYKSDGPAGRPGTALGSAPGAVSVGQPFGQTFSGVDCAATNVTLTSGSVYVGPRWDAAANPDFFVCGDESMGTPPATMWDSADAGVSWELVTAGFGDDVEALGVRAEFVALGSDPLPPPGAWLTTTSLPGFQFKVQIGGKAAAKTPACIPQTLCIAAAIPTRAEVFVRIVGPKPNGYLWPSIVKFVGSEVEVWIQKTTGGAIKYYRLAAVPVDSSVLPGLVDHTGFLP